MRYFCGAKGDYAGATFAEQKAALRALLLRSKRRLCGRYFCGAKGGSAGATFAEQKATVGG
ncbi:MAG: hypothetical protein Aurels2KO_53420 [Aureliella sp.]